MAPQDASSEASKLLAKLLMEKANCAGAGLQMVLQSSEKLAGKLQVLQRELPEFVTGLRAA